MRTSEMIFLIVVLTLILAQVYINVKEDKHDK
ncbi:hypothetical protein SAMN04487994_101055 [Dolosicoccus paucivorans]|nr:hypothetical protein SAMN04487994_101055 [Dolosicoccus paucivorans]